VDVVGCILLVELVAVLAAEVLGYDEAIRALQAGADLQDVGLGVDAMGQLVGDQPGVGLEVAIAEATDEGVLSGVWGMGLPVPVQQRRHLVAAVAVLAPV